MSKHSMRRGSSGERERVLQGFLNGLCDGLHDAEALVEDCLAFWPARSTSERLSPRWGTVISTRRPRRSESSRASGRGLGSRRAHR